MNASEIAAALGKRGLGKKKTLTPKQRAEQRKRLAIVREKRWPKKKLTG
jgi:hypothetical protein